MFKINLEILNLMQEESFFPDFPENGDIFSSSFCQRKNKPCAKIFFVVIPFGKFAQELQNKRIAVMSFSIVPRRGRIIMKMNDMQDGDKNLLTVCLI